MYTRRQIMTSGIMTQATSKFDPEWLVLLRGEVERRLRSRYAPEDIEDVVQEASLALLERNLPSDDGVVLNAARYAVLRFLSKQPPHEVLESELTPASEIIADELQEETGAEAHQFLTVVTSETPESFAMADDLWHLITELSGDLPIAVVRAFRMRELESMSYSAIARELGVQRRTVYEWVVLCRNKLQQRLKEAHVTY
jgi:RNA polymerase sigma factor (sigma-70 family)